MEYEIDRDYDDEDRDPYCLCCVCLGKKCIMWHPGHDHRDGEFTDLDDMYPDERLIDEY